MQRWLISLGSIATIIGLALSLAPVGQAQGGRGAAGRGRGGFAQPPPPRAIAGRGVDVPGWWARLDDPKQMNLPLTFVASGGGLHATTGPNVIFWDPQQTAKGNFTVKATFTMTRLPNHQVAYGLFIGGQDLDKDTQRYSYFVIREDGKFLIKKRNGASTSNVGGDWADNDAVVKPDASGKLSNELAIRVADGQATFLANGKQVAEHPASAIDTDGVVGLRIGHMLDVQIDGLTVDAQNKE
jgi:hypothetical protein